MLRMMLITAVGLTTTLAAGCGDTELAPKPADEKPTPVVTQDNLLLTSEPAGAKGVIELKADVKDRDEVVVVGRIGGSKTPFTGRAAFTIVDLEFEVCEHSKRPWEFCCTAAEDLAKGTVLVKFVDAAGKTRGEDARTLLGLKEMQVVVVRGQVRRDEGSLSIIASGLFIKQEK